jgi:glycosyltransferase involved in cell wall biosynthesis
MITVVSAYRNDKYYIEDCIESVQKASEQAIMPVEHIICDDASSITIPRSLLPKGTKVLRLSENLGPAAARNAAIKEAKYDWILNLDSDDMIDPEYLSTCAPYLPSYDVVYTNSHWFGAVDRDFQQWPLDHKARFINHPLSSCLLFKKSIWEEVGGYNEDKRLIGFEDWAFSLALAKHKCKWKHLPDHLYMYRRKESGSLYESVVHKKRDVTEILGELYA